MKTWTILVFFVGLNSILFCLPLSAAEEPAANSEFLHLKSTYESDLQKINDDDLSIIMSQQDKLLTAMKAVQKKVQAAGQLEPLLIIGNEIERFTNQKRIDPDNLCTNIPDIVQLQTAYLKSVENLPLNKAKKVILLAQNYEKALSVLQETYTRNNNIRTAVEIKTERDALVNSSDLMTARAAVAEAESKATAEKQADKPETQTGSTSNRNAGATAVAKGEIPGKKKYTVSAEKRIRQRFDELCKSLLAQDITKASEFAEPEYVDRVGIDVVQRNLLSVFPFLRQADGLRQKSGIDTLKIADTGKNATLVPRVWFRNHWLERPASQWIESDGEWYVDLSSFSSGAKNRPAKQKPEASPMNVRPNVR